MRVSNVRFLKPMSSLMSKVDVRARKQRGASRASDSEPDINDDVGFKKRTSGSHHQLFKFPQIKQGGLSFLVGTNSAERVNYLVHPSVFHF